MATNINLKTIKELPPYVKIIFSLLPSVLAIILFLFLFYSPKQKEIKSLNSEISQIENDIRTSEVKVRKLKALKIENARLKAKLTRLQEMLPDDKEISVLLKQLSELGLQSGLEVMLWKPQASKVASNALYLEIPVKVEMFGTYHNIGLFFSKLSEFKRIVNVLDVKMHPFKKKTSNDDLQRIKISFKVVTFASVPKGATRDIGKNKKKGRRGRKKA